MKKWGKCLIVIVVMKNSDITEVYFNIDIVKYTLYESVFIPYLSYLKKCYFVFI